MTLHGASVWRGLVATVIALAPNSVRGFTIAPSEIVGSWQAAERAQGAELAGRLLFKSTEASADAALGCRYAGIRQLTATRWYVDLACDDGARFDLDINRVSADKLLIASRPLGEARWFVRDGEEGRS